MTQRMSTLDGVFVRAFAAALAASILAGFAFISLAHAQTPQQAGVTAAVRGQVEIAAAPGAVGKLVKSGEPVYLGNAVRSGPESGLQILLLDQTTFTIGPNSELTIDKFVFDPEKGTGKVSASVAKGVFRFVTGKVAQTNPSDMEVKLPVGTIGIRGTIAMGSVGEGGGSGNGANGANGNTATQIVLVGPGKDLEGNNRPGGLTLGANGGGQQNIDRPGFGSIFGQGGWGAPVFYTPEMMGALQGRLVSFTVQGGQQGQGGGQQGQGGGQQGQGGQASQNAGVGQTQGKGDANNAGGLNHQNRINQLLIGGATSDQRRNDSAGGNLGNDVIGGTTTIGQLIRFVNGKFHFTQNNVPISDGFYNININIDGGARRVAVADSFIELNTTAVKGKGYAFSEFYGNDPATDLAQGFLNGQGDFTGTACGASGSCDVNLFIKFLNSGGKIGGKMDHTLEVLTDQNVRLFMGSGTASEAAGNISDPNKLADGNATFAQLRTQLAGKYYYHTSPKSLSSGGSYFFNANVNFATREFGGGNSRAVFNGTNFSGAIPLEVKNFTSLAGVATFDYLNRTNVTGAGCAGTNCNTDFRITLQNKDGILAKTAAHNVEVRNFSNTVIATGAGTNAQRSEGTAPAP